MSQTKKRIVSLAGCAFDQFVRLDILDDGTIVDTAGDLDLIEGPADPVAVARDLIEEESERQRERAELLGKAMTVITDRRDQDSLGLCTSCGRRPRRDGPGYLLCEQCYDEEDGRHGGSGWRHRGDRVRRADKGG